MPEIINKNGLVSVEEQLSHLNFSKLWEVLSDSNLKLRDLGIKTSVATIFNGAIAYGSRYEDRRCPQGGTIPTPLNCLVSLFHAEPELQQLEPKKFEKLAETIGVMSLAAQVIADAKGPFRWPEQFTKSPQERLSEL